MSSLATIVRINRKDGTQNGKTCFRCSITADRVDYLENGYIQEQYSFLEADDEIKSQKRFVEDHVDIWTKEILNGQTPFVVVTGTKDSGKNYLLKGSNSMPGIIPQIQKRFVQLATDSKVSSWFSYVRFCNGFFLDMLASTYTTVGLTESNGKSCFSSSNNIPLKDLKCLNSIESIITTNSNSIYSDSFKTHHFYSFWIFSCRTKQSTGSQVNTLIVSDVQLDDVSILQPFVSSFSSPHSFSTFDSSSITTILCTLASTSTIPTLIACIDSIPTPLSLTLLSLLSQSITDNTTHTVSSPITNINDPIVLINSSSDSFIESDSDSSIEQIEESQSSRSFETPKKTMKRVIQRSMINEKVYKSNSFTPISRSYIYENESRLAHLLNGKPVLSPCSRISKAKQLIMEGREKEIHGHLSDALSLYQEAQIYLPDNEKLKSKLENIQFLIQSVSTAGGEIAANEEKKEDKLLQVLNFSGLNGLVRLRRIGESKAKKVLQERENGLFKSIDELCRIGMSVNSINTFKHENGL